MNSISNFDLTPPVHCQNKTTDKKKYLKILDILIVKLEFYKEKVREIDKRYNKYDCLESWQCWLHTAQSTKFHNRGNVACGPFLLKLLS